MLTVNSIAENGTAINGYYVTLYENGKVIATGYTQVSFTLTNNQAYQIESHNYGSYAFDYWADTGNATQLRSISIDKNTTLLAVYKPTGGSTPPSGDSYISINTMLSNGTQISGYYTTLWQNNQVIASGFSPYTFTVACCKTYQVEVADYKNLMLSHWGDGNTTRRRTVIPTNQGTVIMTGIYTDVLSIAVGSALFTDGSNRSITAVVTNNGASSVNLNQITNLASTDSRVTVKLSTSLPVIIPSKGGIGPFNFTIQVASNAPVQSYNVTGTAEFSDSVDLNFVGTIFVSPYMLNVASATMNPQGQFSTVISPLSQSILKDVAAGPNFTLTNDMTYPSGHQSLISYTNGYLKKTNLTSSVVINLTSSTSNFIIENTTWNSITYSGSQIVDRQSGINYSLFLLKEYNQYNVSIMATFSSCGCAHVDVRWTSNSLTDLHLGDTLNITGITNLDQFFQGVYSAISSLSGYYDSSGNSTLETLGQRYSEILPSINYTLDNLPTSLQKLSVSAGSGSVTDYDPFACVLAIMGLIEVIASIVASALACASTPLFGFTVFACWLLLLELDVFLPAAILAVSIEC